MKKAKNLLCLLLAICLTFSLVACGGNNKTDNSGNGTATNAKANSLKIGVILVGDETEGYTKAHMDGIKAAAEKLGIPSSNIIWKYKVPESSECSDAAQDLVAQGCKIVLSNSYGHQTYMATVAEEYPEVTFVAMTGDFAAVSGLSNLKNAFTNVYESRYVSGVVAGLKLKELSENGTLTVEAHPENFDKDGNVKIGYVGAYPYAEVVSGYTAFYLGIKSVFPTVVMEVKYTNSWFDIDKEGAAAEALIANGCVVIGQHADSTGAPAAVQKLQDSGKICYSVGYNVDMLETAPKAALTSATNNWEVYYEYAFNQMLEGKTVDTDWASGYNANAVGITKLGESVAEGTAEKVAEVEAALRDGSLHVFDTTTFTVGGKPVTTAPIDLSFMDYSGDQPKVIYQGETKEAVADGYFSESTLRSAPYFSLRIDGITEDAEAAQ